MVVTQWLADTKTKMLRVVEHFSTAIARVRSGRAHPDLLSGLLVEYYGASVPLNQIASISAEGARTLVVSVYDKSAVSVVEKAILASDLGLNPATAGTVLRIPLPPLTEETRRALGKVIRSEAEQARVVVRNIRREVNEQIKRAGKERRIGEDDERQAQNEVQKLTDQTIEAIDRRCQEKEQELMAF